MKRITFILSSVVISLYCFGQNAEATKSYNQGNKYFKQKDFNTAIECYSLSLIKGPNADAYLKRALSYLNLHDTCSYCKDLKLAYMYDNQDAEKMYNKNCVLHDTVFETTDSIKEEFPGYYYSVVTRFKDTAITHVTCFDKQNKEIESIYNIPPEFPGGDEARIRFLQKNIIYPQEARVYGIHGTVYAKFIVTKNGLIKNIEIIKSVGGGCDEEFIRILKLMPRWKPGTSKGKPIDVPFFMSLKFSLSG
ncbi:MAG TPA: energy transducer TonB [Bacteroidales bacterium]|nr:energy transducer TonB [Bacteroidales bacterium]